MRRRSILKGILAAGAGATTGLGIPFAHGADYRGKFLVVVQADGGWDVTSFCDPKVNQEGEEVINHWAEEDEPRQAGNIWYAPFAKNEEFFERHHDKMLVINGVDAQTNSHTAGVVHNWSGLIAEGYPTLTALFASQLAPDLPLPYVSFGGYAETGRLTRYTRLDSPGQLGHVAYPRGVGEHAFFPQEVWRAMEAHRAARVDLLASDENLLPTEEWNIELYRAAMASSDGLRAFVDAIPPEDQLPKPDETLQGTDHYRSELRHQVQLAVLAFKTGVAVSADLYLSGFDTHARNDPGQRWLLGNLADSVTWLWDYAGELGVDDELIVVLGSDFGRTNHYNSDDGKDHWPYGSYIVMEKNQPSWTNRVVGETNELHHAYNIDPATLGRVGDSDPNGTHIYPKHVHKALRKYLGIEESPGGLRFPFSNTEDFAFFG